MPKRCVALIVWWWYHHCVFWKQTMKKLSKLHLRLIFFKTVGIFAAMLLSACQVEPPAPPAVDIEGLSIEKKGYLQSGLIELVPDDLPAPILPENPTQADLGAETYYQICLACHGNWGQGLTDEWREIGFGEDMNCWQSKCHASNHPPQGFVFPRQVPPVLGKGAMSGISSAGQLYQVIFETMPWWFPGSLSEEEALNLTAYIMRARGELPEGIVLTESNLTAFSLHSPAAEIVDEKPGGLILITGLSVAMLAYVWTIRFPDMKKK
jgi:hypothetical protein